MSRNIYLLPWATNNDAHARADEVLHVELDWRPHGADTDTLGDAIDSIDGRDVPRGFSCRLARTPNDEHTCYGQVDEDNYGDTLRWVPAGALAALATHPQVICAPRNKAAFAYVAALPAEWPVTLFWS